MCNRRRPATRGLQPPTVLMLPHVPDRSVTKKRANRKLTIGIDVGDRSSRYCILDGEGEVLAEGSVATTKKGLARVFGSKPRSRVALGVGKSSSACSDPR